MRYDWDDHHGTFGSALGRDVPYSGSFLFSYERLHAGAVARPGEHGVFMTTGPGSTIETALVRW